MYYYLFQQSIDFWLNFIVRSVFIDFSVLQSKVTVQNIFHESFTFLIHVFLLL